MLFGWPDDTPTPSYAHVGAGETKMFYDAIIAEPKTVADGFPEGVSLWRATLEDCAEVFAPSRKWASTR
jgi:hypothetical protein